MNLAFFFIWMQSVQCDWTNLRLFFFFFLRHWCRSRYRTILFREAFSVASLESYIELHVGEKKKTTMIGQTHKSQRLGKETHRPANGMQRLTKTWLTCTFTKSVLRSYQGNELQRQEYAY